MRQWPRTGKNGKNRDMNAKEMYRQLQKLIDQACEEGSFLLVIRGAEALGMLGGVTNQSFTLDYDFEKVDGEGSKTTLNFHSYDQSKAFSIQPDMNKFVLTLTHPSGISEVHKNYYEG
jgi:hypothetical protein